MPEEEDAIDDDEDDFFGNPLKHLMYKVKSAKNNEVTNDLRKKDQEKPIKKNTKAKKTNAQGLTDEDDDLLTLRGKRKAKEDSVLSKIEQEIKELENFSNTSTFPSFGSNPVTSNLIAKNRERKRKVMDDSNSNLPPKSIIIDGGTLEADDITFTKEKAFVVDPHCSIEIGDLESCDTYIKRWKMNETFTNIIKMYATNWSCSPENVILSLRNGKQISAEDTPYSVAFSEKDVNYLSVYKNIRSESYKTNTITVKWLLPERSEPIITAVPKDIPFMILKRNFAISNVLDEEKITLVFDNERINPQETVNTLGIEDGDCIDVYMK